MTSFKHILGLTGAVVLLAACGGADTPEATETKVAAAEVEALAGCFA